VDITWAGTRTVAPAELETEDGVTVADKGSEEVALEVDVEFAVVMVTAQFDSQLNTESGETSPTV